MRNHGLRDLMGMLDRFRDGGIRNMIGAAALVACSLSPLQAGATLVLSPDGITVYDSANNISWLANANLAATNRFGLPVCNASGTQPCVNPSGSMSYKSAAAWVQAMNAANYLGNTNWQLPTTPLADSGCGFVGPQNNSFGYGCSASALGSLYYNALGLKSPNTAVPIPTIRPVRSAISSLICIGRKQPPRTTPAMAPFLSTAGSREAIRRRITCMFCQ